jgi:hypothetical protein
MWERGGCERVKVEKGNDRVTNVGFDGAAVVKKTDKSNF